LGGSVRVPLDILREWWYIARHFSESFSPPGASMVIPLC
jgi:hypothetical protein